MALVYERLAGVYERGIGVAPMGAQRSMATSTESFAADPLGRTRHSFMMLRYSPASAATLRGHALFCRECKPRSAPH